MMHVKVRVFVIKESWRVVVNGVDTVWVHQIKEWSDTEAFVDAFTIATSGRGVTCRIGTFVEVVTSDGIHRRDHKLVSFRVRRVNEITR